MRNTPEQLADPIRLGEDSSLDLKELPDFLARLFELSGTRPVYEMFGCELRPTFAASPGEVD